MVEPRTPAEMRRRADGLETALRRVRASGGPDSPGTQKAYSRAAFEVELLRMRADALENPDARPAPAPVYTEEKSMILAIIAFIVGLIVGAVVASFVVRGLLKKHIDALKTDLKQQFGTHLSQITSLVKSATSPAKKKGAVPPPPAKDKNPPKSGA